MSVVRRADEVTIKWQRAEWLEDAIAVPLTDERRAEIDGQYAGDIEAWAIEHFDDLYGAAVAAKSDDERGVTVDPSTPRLLWEDEHKSNVDSIDSDYIVETYG